MKKYLLLAIIGLMGMTVSAQEISTEQYSIITKRTADWCPFCGQWGWTLFKDIVDEKGDRPTVAWAAHFSGNLQNDVAKAITNNLGGAGQPLFFVNDSDINAGSNNINAKKEEAFSFVEEFALFPALVGIGIEAYMDNNNTVDVSAKVQFQETLDGEYSFAIYLVRDHLIANQASQGANADHRNMLMGELSDLPFGEALGMGEIKAGEEFTFTKQIENFDLHSGKIEDIQFVGVVWNKNGNYRYINALPTTLQMVSNTSTVSADQIDYQIVDQNLTVSVEGINSQVSVALQSINGQVVAQRNTSSQVSFDTANLTAGMYIINVQGNNINASKKIMINN